MKASDGAEEGRAAVFLDRDGTIIEHVHYIADPSHVRLIPGAVEGLRRLGEAGFALVVITNQSAIGRGMISVDQYDAVDAETRRQLAEAGVTLDGVYYCPEVPAGSDPTVVTHDDRKPGPGMLLRAARELGLDPGRSWMVGDMISDVLAGKNAGCLGSILVRTGKEVDVDDGPPGGVSYLMVDDLPAAVDAILGSPEGPATSRRGDIP